MRDSKLALRTAYYETLQSVTLRGNAVPIWDRVPTTQLYPWIKLSTQTAQKGLSGKLDCKIQDATLLIDIVTGYDGSGGGKKDADLIADQVYQLLVPETTAELPSLGDDFRLVSTTVESDLDMEAMVGTAYEIRRLIRLRSVIEQLN